MGQFIQQYKFTLATLAPVFIGSGQTYTTKEYILEDGEVYFPNMIKIYQHIAKNYPAKLGVYEEFLMTLQRKGRTERLPDILRRLDVKSRDFGGYRLSVRDVDFDTTKGRLNEIGAFVKDAFGQPYIPGSSLKGALRTIICNVKFGVDNSKDRGRNVIRIPWGAKRGEAFSDFFHDIRVSDSEPLSRQCLMICQKIDFAKGKERPNPPLPIARECIKPRNVIEFTITCEGREANEAMEQLVQWSRNHYDRYDEYFLSTETKPAYVQDNPPKGGCLYLGGGAGFWTKTIIGKAQIRGSREIPLKTEKGVHKLTKARIDGAGLNNKENLFEMGKCAFLIEKL
ncbi:type III-A CRISPR-associated RAMP protein Csm5 [uncultured Abiotrophia sp.]|jgi:CRISPR-associated RAMP protein, csm5 family|uniref:type III-A CRISPR-associated RAMP protein Csm5 n=1 Tax=uncultured Abiotrophia sp. TaxID=316094 RepID=UPI00288A72CA|nr:type III-A CRISPR-associated RAMP protein Csm5 [uncultured Abiotrophia sp.]